MPLLITEHRALKTHAQSPPVPKRPRRVSVCPARVTRRPATPPHAPPCRERARPEGTLLRRTSPPHGSGGQAVMRNARSASSAPVPEPGRENPGTRTHRTRNGTLQDGAATAAHESDWPRPIPRDKSEQPSSRGFLAMRLPPRAGWWSGKPWRSSDFRSSCTSRALKVNETRRLVRLLF